MPHPLFWNCLHTILLLACGWQLQLFSPAESSMIYGVSVQDIDSRFVFLMCVCVHVCMSTEVDVEAREVNTVFLDCSLHLAF